MKKKLENCPECGAKLGTYFEFQPFPGRYICFNCRWNDIPLKHVTKEQYQYWYRLERIKRCGYQVHPPMRKQPLDILRPVAHRLVCSEVPRQIQLHIEEAAGWIRWGCELSKSFPNRSMWEYHLMKEEGEIATIGEYLEIIQQRRQAEAEEDLSGYWACSQCGRVLIDVGQPEYCCGGLMSKAWTVEYYES